VSDYDGIQFSDRPCWEHTAKELFAVLGKRVLSLFSKMIGFKPFLPVPRTWLLVKGLIRDWIWFCVCVMVLSALWGLKLFRADGVIRRIRSYLSMRKNKTKFRHCGRITSLVILMNFLMTFQAHGEPLMTQPPNLSENETKRYYVIARSFAGSFPRSFALLWTMRRLVNRRAGAKLQRNMQNTLRSGRIMLNGRRPPSCGACGQGESGKHARREVMRSEA
jgi:hypothetical protein